MLNIDRLSEWEKGAVISYCMHVLTNEQRLKLMRALPEAYNLLVGSIVMEVSQKRVDQGRAPSSSRNGIGLFVQEGLNAPTTGEV